MSLEVLTTLVCTSCGKAFNKKPSTKGGFELRAEAIEAGWHCANSIDHCPKCKSKQKRQPTKRKKAKPAKYPHPNPEPMADFGKAYKMLLNASDEELAKVAAGSLRSDAKVMVKAARAIIQARETERRNSDAFQARRSRGGSA